MVKTKKKVEDMNAEEFMVDGLNSSDDDQDEVDSDNSETEQKKDVNTDSMTK